MAWRHGWAIAATAVLVVSLSSARGWAWNLGFVAPGLKLTTFVSEKVEYDSNVLLSSGSPEGDTVLQTVPGFLLEYAVGPAVLTVGYKLEHLKYLTLAEFDTTHQAGLLDLLYESAAGLRVEVKDDYQLTSYPQTTEQRGRRESTTNRARAEAEYRLLDRWALGAAYENTRISYAEEKTAAEEPLSTLSRYENVASLTGFWRFQPKTSLLLRYSLGRKDFDQEAGRNVTRHVIEAGLQGALTSRLSSTFRLGFEDRQPRSENIKGYRGLIAGGDWTFVMFERTSLVLATDRRAEESTFAGNSFFVTTYGTLRASHEINPKIKASLQASFGMNDYRNKALDEDGQAKWRSDRFLSAGAGVVYDIQRWLQVGADYTYTRGDSNFEGAGYGSHRVSGTLTLQF